jgi:hypothetical protein
LRRRRRFEFAGVDTACAIASAGRSVVPPLAARLYEIGSSPVTNSATRAATTPATPNSTNMPTMERGGGAQPVWFGHCCRRERVRNTMALDHDLLVQVIANDRLTKPAVYQRDRPRLPIRCHNTAKVQQGQKWLLSGYQIRMNRCKIAWCPSKLMKFCHKRSRCGHPNRELSRPEENIRLCID